MTMRSAFVLAATLGCCLAADNSHVVVANAGDSTASIYAPFVITNGDPGLKLLKTLPVGKTPNETCILPDGKRAYVSNRGDTTVTVLDLDTLTVAATINDPGMKSPDGCVLNQAGTRLYIAAAGTDSVFVFSTDDNRKVNEIKVGKEPRRLLFSKDETKLYVSNGEERYVSVVDCKTNQEISRIRAGRDPRSMVLSPEGKFLAIGNVSDDTVQFVRIGETSPEYVTGVPRSPQRLLVLPSKEILCVLGRYDNVVALVDLRQTPEYGRFLSVTIPVGRGPWGMALSAAGDCLYVTNTTDSTMTLIDLRTMHAYLTMPTGKGPMGVAAR
jgi:YVTN family beta-propeller protein